MKHLFLILILLFVLIAILFGNQLEYFYNGKFYDRIKYIEYKGTKQETKTTEKVDGYFIQTYRIPYNVFIYEIHCIHIYEIECKQKINFHNLSDSSNIMTDYECKILKTQ